VCVRRAWLTLDALTVALEDPAGQWVCTELDLGWPDVRDVVNNRPDQDGIDDRTRFFGARAISASITSTPVLAQPDTLAGLFAPFMVPAARPVLHYVLDRPGTPEMTMTVRAASFAWPVSGKRVRNLELQWVASDPLPRSATVKTAAAFAGSALSGRTYPLTFNRTYPAGGQAATTGQIRSDGDQPFGPLFRIYGPVTGPWLRVTNQITGDTLVWLVFSNAFTLAAGHYVEIDTTARTILVDGDPAQSAYQQVMWAASSWRKLQPGVTSLMTLSGTSTSGVTQAVATWQDVYLI